MVWSCCGSLFHYVRRASAILTLPHRTKLHHHHSVKFNHLVSHQTLNAWINVSTQKTVSVVLCTIKQVVCASNYHQNDSFTLTHSARLFITQSESAAAVALVLDGSFTHNTQRSVLLKYGAKANRTTTKLRYKIHCTQNFVVFVPAGPFLLGYLSLAG